MHDSQLKLIQIADIEYSMHKLNQIKDNSVFKLLEKLLEEQAFTTIGQTMKVCCLF